MRIKDVSKRLAMFYLANDILQNSRKKGAQFVVEFYHKLPAAIQQLVKQGDGKVSLIYYCFYCHIFRMMSADHLQFLGHSHTFILCTLGIREGLPG